MAAYELVLIIRQLPRTELISTLKRTGEAIFSRGGVIQKIDNLGFNQLPCKISKNQMPYRQGHHFIYTFDMPKDQTTDFESETQIDVDILRTKIFRVDQPKKVSCTIAEEMVEPAYRPDVQKLLQLQRKKSTNRRQWTQRSGLPYYPFQH